MFYVLCEAILIVLLFFYLCHHSYTSRSYIVADTLSQDVLIPTELYEATAYASSTYDVTGTGFTGVLCGGANLQNGASNLRASVMMNVIDHGYWGVRYMHQPRMLHSLAMANGYILIFGGLYACHLVVSMSLEFLPYCIYLSTFFLYPPPPFHITGYCTHNDVSQ